MHLVAFSAWVDVGALALLALFGLWGALHGAVRQGLGLGVLAAGLGLAGPIAPRLESSLSKVVTLSPTGTACAAWGTALLGILLAGGVVLHLLRVRLGGARLGAYDRPIGAVIGLVKGLLVVALFVYVLLGASLGKSPPPLAHSVASSVAARAARSLEFHYRDLWGLSPLVERRVEDIDATIGAGAAP